MKKMGVFVLTIVFLFGVFAIPAAAEPQAGEAVEVKLKIGDENIEINGEKMTIQKPFKTQGTTLVPLRVITSALGAILSWDPKTETIVLKYGDNTIELQVGSNIAKVNGKETTTPIATQKINGVTMVPLRFITDNFGAKLQYNKETEEIVLTGTKLENPDDGASSTIDSDAGKTKIGDSYFGWSMNYPTGLITDSQSYDGSWAVFADAKNQYLISIRVDENEDDYEQSDLLDYLSDITYGTVIDKRMMSDRIPAYAKIVTKTSDGYYTEKRAYLHEDKIYVYSFHIKREADYKNAAKKKVFQELMDSFALSFDKSDQTLKDISPVKDGYINYKNDDYGLSLDLPVNWKVIEGDHGIKFYDPDSLQSLNFSMSSLAEGDTLDQWIGRHENRFKQEFVENYREISPIANLIVAGVPAKNRFLSYSYGKYWGQWYDIFLIKGNYKFNFTHDYKREELPKIVNTIGRIDQSIKLDFRKIEDTFGFVEDEYDIDLNEKRTVTSKEFGFSIKVPRYWEEGSEHGIVGVLQYLFTGGWFQVTSFSGVNTDEFIRQMEDTYENSVKLTSDSKIIEETTTTLNNISTNKYVMSTIDDYGNPMTSTSFVFSKGDTVYTIEYWYTDGVRTPELIRRINDALASFVFK